jgi:hypothetical protein
VRRTGGRYRRANAAPELARLPSVLTTKASEFECQGQLMAGVCSMGSYSSGSNSRRRNCRAWPTTPITSRHAVQNPLATRDALPHGALVRPQSPSECLIDHDDWRRIASIGAGERTGT